MKRMLGILFLSTIYFTVDGQWAICSNIITFDPGDNLYPVAITIDTTNYHHNIWQVGAPHKTVFTTAHSRPNAIVTDTLNPYAVNDTSVFTLKIPGQIETYLDWVYFYYQLNIDSGTKAKVEWSKDSSRHWVNIIDSLPSPFAWDGRPIDSFSSSTTGWTGFGMDDGPGFGGPVDFDTLLLRFTFISDSVPSTKDGWMIDDISTVYYCENYVPQMQTKDMISIFPNPATAKLTISLPNNITKVTISNLIGQVVFSNQCASKQVQVDVSYLPPGIYLIKINGSEVRKFIKE